jgi:hypothetical protein
MLQRIESVLGISDAYKALEFVEIGITPTFDKKYFFDLQRLDNDAPIAIRDLGNAVRALWSIINKY